MFDLLAYKRRLQTIRAELVAIDADLSNLPAEDLEESKSLTAVALSVAKVCRILVRVIDSLPGK